MKILQICSKIPFPPKDGGSLAMNIMTEGLQNAGHEVQVLAINTPKHFVAEEDLPAAYRERCSYRSVLIDTTVRFSGALLNLFSRDSYHVSRFRSPAFEKALKEVLSGQRFDIVQLEGLWVSPYVELIRKHSKAKIVLRAHNVEHQIWERLAASAGPLKRIYLGLLASRLKKYEQRMLNEYDAILAITEKDLRAFLHMGAAVPCRQIPFGVDLKRYVPDGAGLQDAVIHIGAMDWLPNQEGISWIRKEVWPLVIRKRPAAVLHLAGRNMPAELLAHLEKNMLVHGEVADAHNFMKKARLMIVPLNSGGGMRVKIIEGMALARTIISTSVGAEGIEYSRDHNIIIADTAQEFAEAILRCMNDPALSEEIGKHARELVEEKYDHEKIMDHLTEFYKDLLK